MPLQHQLRSPALVPKLHTTVLRTRDDPLAIMRDSNGEHIIFMTREIEQALAEPVASFTGVVNSRTELPVLERLIERAGDQALAVGRKGDRVDRVAVPTETVDQRARRNVPDAHDSVQRPRGNEACIGRDGHARHAGVDVGIVVDREHL